MPHAPPPSPLPVAALVLGAAVWPGGIASPTLERRARHAAKLWHEGKVGRIIGCGGVGKLPPSEAQIILDICHNCGVPNDVLHQENQSTTTDENIRFALPILKSLNCSSVVVVTDLYHTPRALLVARGYGLNAKTSSPSLKGAHPLRLLRAILREVPAFLLYTLRLIRRKIAGLK